jgi:hypothetical protein
MSIFTQRLALSTFLGKYCSEYLLSLFLLTCLPPGARPAIDKGTADSKMAVVNPWDL